MNKTAIEDRDIKPAPSFKNVENRIGLLAILIEIAFDRTSYERIETQRLLLKLERVLFRLKIQVNPVVGEEFPQIEDFSFLFS